MFLCVYVCMYVLMNVCMCEFECVHTSVYGVCVSVRVVKQDKEELQYQKSQPLIITQHSVNTHVTSHALRYCHGDSLLRGFWENV